MAGTAEKYLKPEVIRQVARLDLRAKFIVEGFIAGLHASPFQGFSVEFSEHRKYTSGDNISDIDWNVYAKTDRYYIKKVQAETNLTGYMVMDLSGSMGYTYRQELTKFEYSISLAAAVALVRRTGDRARDVNERVAQEVEKRLVSAGAKPEQVRAVREVVAVDKTDRAAFFGDTLPIGLRLVD